MDKTLENTLEQCFPRKERYECVERHITFTIYFSDEFQIPGKTGIVCIHGAGYSGLTFAALAQKLRENTIDPATYCLIAPDLRGHGDTESSDELDLSIETLVGDIEALYSGYLKKEPRSITRLVMVGWSMGAAVAIKASLRGEIANSIIGLIAIDVVEGTAIEALKSMSSILAARPKGFTSMDHAVEWALSSGTARRLESARLSIPGMLRENMASGFGCADDQSQSHPPKRVGNSMKAPLPLYGQHVDLGSIQEGSTVPAFNRIDNQQYLDCENYKYIWRTPLALSEKYWVGWFDGLSQAFLDIPCPKLLLLAGHDRLDTTLMIAQMQGKFQLVVIPKAGHAIHEDQPDLVAQKIAAFLQRYNLLQEQLR